MAICNPRNLNHESQTLRPGRTLVPGVGRCFLGSMDNYSCQLQSFLTGCVSPHWRMGIEIKIPSFIQGGQCSSTPCCGFPEWYSKLVAKDGMETRCLEWAQDLWLCFSAWHKYQAYGSFGNCHWALTLPLPFTEIYEVSFSCFPCFKRTHILLRPATSESCKETLDGTDAEIEGSMLNSLNTGQGITPASISFLGNLENICWYNS